MTRRPIRKFLEGRPDAHYVGSVPVNHVRYRVFWLDLSDSDCVGFTSPNRDAIGIHSGLRVEEVMPVLGHELAHAAIDAYRIKGSMEDRLEDICDAFGQTLEQCWPDFVNAYTKLRKLAETNDPSEGDASSDGS